MTLARPFHEFAGFDLVIALNIKAIFTNEIFFLQNICWFKDQIKPRPLLPTHSPQNAVPGKYALKMSLTHFCGQCCA